MQSFVGKLTSAVVVHAAARGAARRSDVERLVVIDSRLPLVVRARGDLVVLERRLVILVAASAVSEHSGDGTVSGRVDVRGAVPSLRFWCLSRGGVETPIPPQTCQ